MMSMTAIIISLGFWIIGVILLIVSFLVAQVKSWYNLGIGLWCFALCSLMLAVFSPHF
jgi:hypothetical protein